METEAKVDPRIMRTRKLIVDAFEGLLHGNDFKSTSIKDITDAATVNRATFYAHFADKYELLDAVLTDYLVKNVRDSLQCHAQLDEDSVAKVFLAIAKFQKDLSVTCKRSYESIRPMAENKIKEELKTVFYHLIVKQDPESEREQAPIWSVLLSWQIYGACLDWQSNSSLTAEDYIEKAMPFLFKGMGALKI
ncbi:TetR/AcrR family transcriptional regulator [Paenibacillus sacheonensis]|uniref:TetR family transcriptional regulator n=1 Tax=Paenibacillus sacheonensis TaxID=742054 RepID=A0A7X4YQC4_9BACL|nr:TetR/AcrR family transcriptional regulator [Paenibacillus sacheonensis]MBM7566336.1 AcrR family transcriptional regulator [Paenibacillus sacheonensis]NBC70540.1 TetR family transcriptional regulator [Paenibacillus sacheonensis]